MMSPALIHQLNELRSRLLIALGFMAVAMVVLYSIKERLLGWLLLPLTAIPEAPEMIVFSSVQEQFFVYLRLTTWGGVFIALPFLLYQIWRFLAPGLYGHERRVVGPLLAAVPVLLYAGGLFAYFVVVPMALSFFLGFSQPGLTILPNVSEYLKILFNFVFAFGLAFNLPVFLLLLVKVGVLSIDKLKRWRRFAIVLIFIFSALVTPPDPFSQIFLALPLIALYELAIWAARWMDVKKA